MRKLKAAKDAIDAVSCLMKMWGQVTLRGELVRTVASEIYNRQVADVERLLVNSLVVFFGDQISTTVERLEKLSTKTPSSKAAADTASNLTTLVFDPTEWHDELIDRTLPILLRAAGESAVVQLLMMGVDVRNSSKMAASEWVPATDLNDLSSVVFDVGDDKIDMSIASDWPLWMRAEIVRQAKEAFSQDFWKAISETTRSDIEKLVYQGVLDGKSIVNIAKSIESMYGPQYTRARATNVARTESGNILNGARKASMDKLTEEIPALRDITQIIWHSVLGDTTRDTHAAMHGVPADAEGMWILSGYRVPWPGHYSLPPNERCNCFPAGTLVSGNFVGAQRAWYEGTFTEVVLCSGGRITFTPNHPIVTSKGLVAAGMLSPGDKVLTYSREADFSSLVASGSDEIENEPLPIEQVFETFLSGAVVCFGSDGVKVISAKEDDFYGDGGAIHGNIDVVRTNWKLLEDGDFGRFQKFGDLVFVPTSPYTSGEFCLRSASSPVQGLFASSSSLPSGTQCSLDVLRGFKISPTGALSIGIGSNFNTSLYKSAAEDGSGVSSFLREAKQRHTRFVTFDNVIQVRNFFSAGHVYDLQSEGGVVLAYDPLYTDIGIVTSNCLCTILHSYGGSDEQAAQAISGYMQSL